MSILVLLLYSGYTLGKVPTFVRLVRKPQATGQDQSKAGGPPRARPGPPPLSCHSVQLHGGSRRPRAGLLMNRRVRPSRVGSRRGDDV